MDVGCIWSGAAFWYAEKPTTVLFFSTMKKDFLVTSSLVFEFGNGFLDDGNTIE